MPLNGSGPISVGGSTAGQSINLEFGRAAGATTSMSQLYRGGGIVPNATANNAIPTSGTISLGNFYGATNRVTINITIASNTANYVLNTAKVAGYVAGITDVVLTINSGVYVSANSTGVYALDVDTSWAAGDTVRINNNGFIVGRGGNGGTSGGATATNQAGLGFSSYRAPTVGASGGPALRVQRATTVQNSGTIGGGGGGGGGGGSAFAWYQDSYSGGNYVLRGSGGGGGRGVSSGGGIGLIDGGSYVINTTAGNGGNGTLTGAGGGGSLTYGGGYSGGAGVGGSGGGLGASGSAGQSGWLTSPATRFNQTGGAAGGGGAAVAGNANITWLATGTRLGAIA